MRRAIYFRRCRARYIAAATIALARIPNAKGARPECQEVVRFSRSQNFHLVMQSCLHPRYEQGAAMKRRKHGSLWALEQSSQNLLFEIVNFVLAQERRLVLP